MASTVGRAYVQIVPTTNGIAGSISNVLQPEAASAGREAGETLASNLTSGMGGVQGSLSGVLSSEAESAGAEAGDTASGGLVSKIQSGFSSIKGKLTSILHPEGSSAGESAGGIAGSKFASAMKTAIAAAGIGKILKESLTTGADLEQAIGGVETLYGDAADKMKEYASQSYANVGISATEYMEQATSFSASLISSLDGDTQAAADVANRIMMDMGDNANKMGTSMESIQNAYQGFAKGNYTMLDNLKLGYGGTKEEMQRLIEEASKMTDVQEELGVTVDSTDMSFANIANAISVVQTNLGIAGATADEAKGTFSGSFNAMKAAAQDLIANLTLGEDIGPSLTALQETVKTFVIDNFFPMLGNIFSNLPAVVGGLGDFIGSFLGSIEEHAEDVAQLGSDVIGGIVEAIVDALPDLIAAAARVVKTFAEAIVEQLPELAERIFDAIPELLSDIVEAFNLPEDFGTGIIEVFDTIKEAFGTLWEAIQNAKDTITEAFAGISTGGLDLQFTISDVFDGIANVISVFVEIVSVTIGVIADTIATLIEEAQTDGTVLNDIVNVCGDVISVVGDIISGVLNVLIDLLNGDFAGAWESTKDMLGDVWEDIKQLVVDGIEYVKDYISTVLGIISSVMSETWDGITGIMSDTWETIKNGVSDTWETIRSTITDTIEGARDAVGDAIDKIRGFFDFEWSLPDLKTPHFSINGDFSLNPPSVPSIGVEWYSKAMSTGMILDGATIFGYDGENLQGGGEAGAEAIVGVGSLYGMITRATREATTGNTINGGVSINVYTQSGQDPEEIAEEVGAILTEQFERAEVYA